jgi:hypothetical protein
VLQIEERTRIDPDIRQQSLHCLGVSAQHNEQDDRGQEYTLVSADDGKDFTFEAAVSGRDDAR